MLLPLLNYLFSRQGMSGLDIHHSIGICHQLGIFALRRKKKLTCESQGTDDKKQPMDCKKRLPILWIDSLRDMYGAVCM